jgi:L-fuculose-phosphate aldolase
MKLEKLLDRLALGCRILASEGHSDMSLGHLSLRDEAGRGFWLKRNRIGLEEVHDASDFVLVDFDGIKISGKGGVHSEWPIHAEVLKMRPDVNVVAHTHAFHASILSSSLHSFTPYTVDADYFTGLPMFKGTSALILTREEGRELAVELAQSFAIMMSNHGITFCGTSIEHAICVGVFLEKAAKVEIVARSASLNAPVLSPAMRVQRTAQIMTPVHWEHSFEYFARRQASAQRQLRDPACRGEFTARNIQ